MGAASAACLGAAASISAANEQWRSVARYDGPLEVKKPERTKCEGCGSYESRPTISGPICSYCRTPKPT